MASGKTEKQTNGGANLGFEAVLWSAADTAIRGSAHLLPHSEANWRGMREVQANRSGHMDAAEYKHVVLGLIFLKYISDASSRKDAQKPQDSGRLANSQRPRGHGRQMNLAIRGIEADLGDELRQAEGSWAANADSFHRDLHKPSRTRRRCRLRQHLKADYILANPPFNDSDWFRKDDDVRWQFGVPPKGNANFAWVQHFIHHLAPQGMAGFVLANGSMSSNQSGEGDIRATFQHRFCQASYASVAA